MLGKCLVGVGRVGVALFVDVELRQCLIEEWLIRPLRVLLAEELIDWLGLTCAGKAQGQRMQGILRLLALGPRQLGQIGHTLCIFGQHQIEHLQEVLDRLIILIFTPQRPAPLVQGLDHHG